MKRNQFLKQVFGFVAGSAVVPNASSAVRLSESAQKTAFNSGDSKDFTIKKGVTFLNNGTLGLSPITVQEAVNQKIKYVNSTGDYHWDRGNLMNSLSQLLGSKPSELFLTHNVTEGVNVLSKGIDLLPGDELILTDQEHVGNAVPWIHEANKNGAKIKILSLKGDNQSILAEFAKMVSSKTKVVAIPHIPCTDGRILPVREIGRLAHENGALVIVDGAHGPGMLKIDVKQLDCDAYISCGHKWLLGPKGIGFVYINSKVQDRFSTSEVGENTFKSWETSNGEASLGEEKSPLKRFEFGTQNTALFTGLQAAIDYHLSLDPQKTESRIRQKAQWLYESLSRIDGKLEVVSPAREIERSAMISFRPKTLELEELYKKLRTNGYIVRIVRESNLNAVRVSTHIYTTKSDLKSFINLLDELL